MRIALKRAGVALAGALLATSVGTSPAYAEPAALTGTITSDATGEAIAGCVNVYDVEYYWQGSTCTEDGSWTVDGLNAGTVYKVEVSANDTSYLGEWAQNALRFDDAAPFTAPATVDVALELGAVVGGTLSVADGDPVPSDTYVQIWSTESGDWVSYASIDDTGNWQALVAAGAYKVQFSGPGVDQWAFSKPSQDEADAVQAVPGQPVRVDDVLPAVDETTFAGSLTSAVDGSPLDGCVTAYKAADEEWAGSACTSGEVPGLWTMTSLSAGVEYRFQAETWGGEYVGEWAHDAAGFEQAQSFTGPATIDFLLDRGAHVEGRIVGADGQPLSWVSASLESSDGAISESVGVWEDGTYSAVVRPGAYVLRAYGDGASVAYAPSARSRDDAEVYNLTTEAPSRIDLRFPAGASVTGTVTSDVDGAPLAGICVDIRNPDPDGFGGGGDCTDAEGRYTVRLEEPGSYIAKFEDTEDWDSEEPGPVGDWVSEYNGNASTRDAAVPFTVEAGSPVTLDASLAPAAVISGIATDAKLGTPLAGVCADAYIGRAGDHVQDSFSVCSEADGRWSVKGLPAGSYALALRQGYEPGAASSIWAFKATSQATADLVTVATGEQKTIRNVKMPTPITISGRITDVNGNPVEGATVNPRGNLMDRSGECYNCATTDGDGRYMLPPLPAGTYRPVAYARWDVPLAPMWSGNSSSYEDAAAITVKSGKTAEFSASLVPASRITGRIVSATGEPLDGWSGEVVTLSGRHVADMDAYPANEFTVRNLPAGTFRVRFEHWETNRVVWLGGVSTPEESTPVTVGVGETKDITFEVP